jgi:hypothetical protein
MKARDVSERFSVAVRRLEWGASLVLTATAVYLITIATIRAGGLWRDEASTIGVATSPRIVDVWHRLQFDSFPLPAMLLMRGIINLVGANNDLALRVLGFCCALGVIATLWFAALQLRSAPPLLSLALLGVNPAFARWATSVRPTALGMIAAVLAAITIWRFVTRPNTTRWTIAIVAAVVSVQVSFFNASALFAMCTAGAVVSLLRKDSHSAIRGILVGAVAALSLAPYAVTARSVSPWIEWMQRVPRFTTGRFFAMLDQSFGPTSLVAFMLFLVLFAAGVLRAALILIRPTNPPIAEARKELIVYSGITVLVSALGLFLFLRVLRYRTEPWYYLGFLALAAVFLNCALFGSERSAVTRILGIATSLILLAAQIPSAQQIATTRVTNVDVAARNLSREAQSDDFILVYEWYYGITFNRYYGGRARWITIPPVADHSTHNFDIPEAELQTDPPSRLGQVMGDLDLTLHRGKRILIVTPNAFWDSALIRTGEMHPVGKYHIAWMKTIGQFLRAHADTITQVPFDNGDAITGYEDVEIFSARGWKK